MGTDGFSPKKRTVVRTLPEPTVGPIGRAGGGVADEFGCRDADRFGEPGDGLDRGGEAADLDIVDRLAGDPGSFGKFSLRQSGAAATVPKTVAELL
jgi:hypothetical protein